MPLWTINATVSNTQRTNNETEAWNNTFAQQIGYSHPSLYRLLDKLSKDTDLVHCKKQYISIHEGSFFDSNNLSL